MLIVNPNELVARAPINRIADIKGKKIRVFASQFETVPFARLGATPVAMTLGDVVPALQQGAIDGALAGIPVLSAMHFKEAAKYITRLGQPMVFGMVEVSKKWFDALPHDLQEIVERTAARESTAINPFASALVGKVFQSWSDSGGELINLPPDQYAALIGTLSAAAEEVAQRTASVAAAYQVVKEAARRVH
jgi:TRAP-type C4-dicarboxylate transport system substrate-binding protein